MTRIIASFVAGLLVAAGCRGGSSDGRRTDEPARDEPTTTTLGYDECYRLGQDELTYHGTPPAEEGYSDGYDDAFEGERYQQSYDPEVDPLDVPESAYDSGEACNVGFEDAYANAYTEAYDSGWADGQNPDTVHFCELFPDSSLC